jgi:hypothetical protein
MSINGAASPEQVEALLKERLGKSEPVAASRPVRPETGPA